MPSIQQVFAFTLQVTNNIAKLVRRKPHIHCNRQVVKQKLGFSIVGSNVNVRGFTALVGIEKGAVRPPS
jgi:hypothetical protein